MGEYFVLHNLSKNQTAQPHDFHYGTKWGEFNPYKIMKLLGWSMSDIVFAEGDYGTSYCLTNSAEIYEEQHLESKATVMDEMKLWIIEARREERAKPTYFSFYQDIETMISTW
jgi:hypothetical protein